MPEVLSTHTPQLFSIAVERAVDALSRGEVVALPTETVYGLAANALDSRAVKRIYALKGRPSFNPVIVHVDSLLLARSLTCDWTELAEELAAAFWPGPLTLIQGKNPAIPDSVTAGGTTVGIRWPSHPLISAVIHVAGFPLAAPSANLSNRVSPTCAAHVVAQFGDRIGLVIDGGDCNVGIESTVVDACGSDPIVLRPGMISAVDINRVCGRTTSPFNERSIPNRGNHEPLRSPGLLSRHYAPRGRVVVWSWTDETDLDRRLASEGVAPDKVVVIAYDRIPMHGRWPNIHLVPNDPEAYARAIYSQLHACDECNIQLIVIETPPIGPVWEGIRDRLARASTPEAPKL